MPFQKGHIGYWKNKHRSRTTKDKISKIEKGKHNSLETEFKKGRHYKHKEGTKEKIKEALMGHLGWNKGEKLGPYSKETKEKMSQNYNYHTNSGCFKKGLPPERHPCWKGGIGKKPYPFDFNKELKELIRKRDHYTCQLCGMPECENGQKLTIHHIDYNKDNLDPKNLTSLCRRCNPKVNFKREHWQKFFGEKIDNAK